MRCFIIDTVATVVFFTTIAAATELFIAGMELREVLITRLIMVPMMVLTGRPYGMWRDWFFKMASPKTTWSRAIVDSFTFIVFQLPIYVLTLVIAGADAKEILSLIVSTSLLMLVVSRPFGIYLEHIPCVGRSNSFALISELYETVLKCSIIWLLLGRMIPYQSSSQRSTSLDRSFFAFNLNEWSHH